MAAERAVVKLSASAGQQEEDVLNLVLKLLNNITEHPGEQKFRRLNTENAKLREGLFKFDGAKALLAAAGFVEAGATLELPAAVNKTFVDARAAVLRRVEIVRDRRQRREMAESSASAVSGYKAAIEGGSQDAGRAELETLLKTPGGPEALQSFERILTNIRRYTDSERYRCISLAKPAGQKVAVAMPLMNIAGFKQGVLENGEHCVRLERMCVDTLERIWAMVWWALRPSPPLADLCPVSSLGENGMHVLGAVLGAAIGDALGAPLAGKRPLDVTAEELDKVMEMCGGGKFAVAPGQVTGNTECMMCLADSLALASENKATEFPAQEVALAYSRWAQSRPFNSDSACAKAFDALLSAEDMEERAKTQNARSRGAGALIRCLPLAALGAARGYPTAFAAVARTDAKLSHPAAVIADASAAYVVTAGHLIATRGDRTAALNSLQEWVKHECGKGRDDGQASGDRPSGWTQLKAEAGKGGADASVDFEELVGFLNMAVGSDEELPFATAAGETGNFDVPLTHAFRNLRDGRTFEAAMRATLAGGGQTHTNAMVVGGLIGAAVGISGIPERWLRAVLTSDTTDGESRPPEYHPSRLPALMAKACAAPAPGPSKGSGGGRLDWNEAGAAASSAA